VQTLAPLSAKPNYRDFAVIVILVTPQGIPMVRERKPNRIPFLKYPGGKRDGEETPEQCAAREMEEETGARVDPEKLILLERQDRGTHDFFAFGIKLPELPVLKHTGDEGEEVGVYSREGLKMRKDVFPKHLEIGAIARFIYG
jgi:8-oxo-dGTP pyrophosphatase MutT (NUDIX family)